MYIVFMCVYHNVTGITGIVTGMTLVLDTTAEFCRQVGGEDSKYHDTYSGNFNKYFCVKSG